MSYDPSEFRPGDVALVATRNVRSEERLGYRVEALNLGGWQIGVSFCDDSLVTDARRLVVIDPESDEDAERLGELVGKWVDRVPYSDMREDGDLTHLDALQAALREFANPKPPRPEEPTGLGAVVEDAKGQRWLAVGGPQEYADEWYSPDLNTRARWGEIPVVRVLSEGVPS